MMLGLKGLPKSISIFQAISFGSRELFFGQPFPTVLKGPFNLEKFIDFRHDCVYCYHLRYPLGCSLSVGEKALIE